jgi:hypothetical protein
VYGVDIQPIAIQISKLRFFISLIVDQKADGAKENNYGIIALPNLETKFVAANTLIGIKREQGGLADPEIDKKQKELLRIRHNHFGAKSTQEKKALRDTDRKVSKELIELLKQDGFYNSADAAQMATWNPYSQTEASAFFDPWWMFGIDKGFDVVIGNPPYVDSEHMVIINGLLRNTYRELYKTAKGNWDLFIIFIEKGIKLLSSQGLISFIVPNKLISQDYASDVRDMISDRILEIRDYSRLNVFENAAVYPITILMKNDKMRDYANMISMSSLITINEIHKVDDAELRHLPWDIFFWDSSIVLILRKINRHNKLMRQFVEFKNPCTVSEAYQIKSKLYDKGIVANAKKFINSGIIDKYSSLWGLKLAAYIKDRYKFPVISLRDLKNISSRRYAQSQSKKIIIANMTQNIEAFLDINAEYLAGKSTIIAIGKESELTFCTALINSKIVSFWYKCIYHSTKMSGEALSITAERLSVIPIPDISMSEKKQLITIVDKIIAAKATDPKADTAALERQIDSLVYRLYNLTYEEVRVIEPEFPLSRAEYEGI